MLANLYRDGHDLVAWHSDDEAALRKHPLIASLSFGDTRMFEMRKKPPPVRISFPIVTQLHFWFVDVTNKTWDLYNLPMK